MEKTRSSFWRRLALRVLTFLLLASLFPVAVSAQPIGDPKQMADLLNNASPPPPSAPTTIVKNVPDAINRQIESITRQLTSAGVLALVNGLQVFFGQVAYDAADYLATGGKGQSALYYQKGFGGYLQDVAGSAAGEFIGSLSQASFFQSAGFDLCRPSDPRTLLRIQLSLSSFLGNVSNGAYQRPASKCDLNDVINNYQNVYQTLSNTDVLSAVNANVDTTSNDLGVSFMIFNRAYSYAVSTKELATQDRKEGGGYQALTDIVSGRIRTPGQTIQDEANQMLVKDPKNHDQMIQQFILNQAWTMGPAYLAKYTASIFVNTFTSKFLRRVMTEGIGVFDAFNYHPHDVVLGGPDDLLEGNPVDARKANIDLLTPNLYQNTGYDVIAEMQTCPQPRGTWNCVLDEGLSQVLRSEGDAGSFTIREAIDRGYLKSDWRLYSSSNQQQERDPLCYTYGYCMGNLRKMRLARILPVGFEFAADDPVNVARCASSQGCVTLGEVVQNFTNCNAEGKKDETHPWCKLIDPNWALTALPQQCALNGFSDGLMGGDLPNRRQECQDIQTCLTRNDKGECVGGYGYCVAEKTAYRFGGQECTPRNASCRTYVSPDTETEVSYLRNTLDYGTCSQDNAGCMWYATKRDPASTRADAWIGTPSSGDRVYFDKTMESCDAADEGCTKLYAVTPGQKALNLIQNSSFETTESGGTVMSVWRPVTGVDRGIVRPTISGVDAAADGQMPAAFLGGFRGGYRQVVDLQPGHNYVISAFVRRLSATGPTPRAMVGVRQYSTRQEAETGTGAIDASALARDYHSRDCTVVDAETDPSLGGITMIQDGVAGSLANTWNRWECTFTANSAAQAGEIMMQGNDSLVDAVQLEEGNVASPYVDGVASGLEEVYQKVAPDDLRCTGGASDSPLCGNYAKMCRQSEAGCDGYTDASGVFPEVAAQVNANDFCPAQCVGYGEYRKLASAFDLVQNTAPELNDATEPKSAYFIPSTAQVCTQEAVGCEEFTDVDAADASGETKAYFNSLRFCEKPADDASTYFTWEGSDSAGYQLRTWSMKRRTTAKPGDVPPEGATITDAAGPRIVVKRSGDLFTQKSPLDCTEATWRLGIDQDCRQFYDAGGHVFYRFYSQTVLSTNDCRNYRLADASSDDCAKTGGTYQAQDRTCTYQAYAPESGMCNAAYAGCRAYAGAEGGNVQTVFYANGTSTTSVTGARVSSESLIVGDQSYRTDVAASGRANNSITFSSTPSGFYRVSFWAKATASSTVVIGIKDPDGGASRLVGTMRLTPDWQKVSYGLFDGSVGRSTAVEWTVTAGSAPVAFFLDEITVQQMRDIVFVRKNTWQTPAMCDQNAYGVPEPQAMAGCRAYQNRDGQTKNVRQFTQLCRPAAIGCREFVDTRNSQSPYREAFSLTDAGTTSVTNHAADRYTYLIDDKSKRCDVSGASCRAFGKPTFSKDRQSIQGFVTVYLKDDVTKYGTGLCRPSELFCEEFKTEGGREYFKNPQNHTCEYREQVRVPAQGGVAEGTYNGWFIPGSTTPCYPNALSSGQSFQMLRTGDLLPAPGYAGWAGLCPQEESECTEYRDPVDTTVSSYGRPYYFIANEQIDTRSCNGAVDPAHGCVPFRNMSDARLLYSTEATLASYQSHQLTAVPPVDCQSNPTQPGCAMVRTGKCTGTKVVTRYTPVYGVGTLSRVIIGTGDAITVSTTYVGGSCSQDTDCAGEAASRLSGRMFTYSLVSGETAHDPEIETHVAGITCNKPSLNDANQIIKVKVDRDCAQWLGCSSGETVYDPSVNRYREVCTQTALCDQGSGSGGNTANYCSNYVARTSTTTEPVLTAGAYFGAAAYTGRSVGAGGRDYSGYSIPNAFQVTDLQSRPISDDVAVGSGRGPEEQRLLVAVKMPPIDSTTIGTGRFAHTVPPTRPTQAQAIPKTDPVYATAGANALLCRHRGTGLIGYFVREEAQRNGQQVNCYLSFRGSSEANQFLALYGRLSSEMQTGKQDLVLDQAYPRSLCRAYPEADAPFSTNVVSAWDMSKNPIAPSDMKSGYENVNVCAYGENCSCSYKRVNYPGEERSRFFADGSEAVPPGVCIGGPRAGQACMPSDVFSISSSTSTSAQVAQAANNAQSCGPASAGGTCAAFSSATVIRGVTGSCLEYDTTHAQGTLGQENYSCLTWNPSPVVGGKEDAFRYVQTAAYFPPQNAGQYYCTSKAGTPKNYNLAEEDFSGNLPAGMSKIGYDDMTVSDGQGCPGDCGNHSGTYFYGMPPKGSSAAAQCEDADDDQDNEGPFDKDPLGIRLVATGRDSSSSYTETFFGLNPGSITSHVTGIRAGSETLVARQKALLDQNISFIEIKPFQNPNGNGRLACGYQENWVDGVHVSDYDSLDETGPADRQWRSAFFGEEDLQTYLTRGNEQVITNSAGTSPMKMPCVSMYDATGGVTLGNGADLPSGSECYFKTWEIGYRASDKQQKFLAFSGSESHAEGGFADIAGGPIMQQCTSAKPYYAIRAVFQTAVASQSVAPGSIKPREVRGPWRLAGFWVSACAGKSTNDNRFIYMNIRVQNADICKDLAEVKSVKTGQDAAFTDRVWSQSKYAVPILGYQYGMTFSPFSSALNTGPAGDDPLFQTGGKLAGSSLVRPPTFLASGYQTYYGPIDPAMPRDKYAYLSNLFARIYRVYHFNEQQIKADDKVCIAGVNQGRKCVPDGATDGVISEAGPSVDCRAAAGNASCDTSAPPAGVKVCNALSGINAGKACTSQPQSCHLYAMDPTATSRAPRPLLTSCNLQAGTGRTGWTRVDNDYYIRNSDGSRHPRQEAAALGAFRCATGAVRVLDDSSATTRGSSSLGGTPIGFGGNATDGYTAAGTVGGITNGTAAPSETVYCTQPADVSQECPIEVIGTCTKTAGASARTPGQCSVHWQGHDETLTNDSCFMDSDCSFTAANFWRNPTDGRLSEGFSLGSSDATNGKYGFVATSRSVVAGTLSGCGTNCRPSDAMLGGTGRIYSTLPTTDPAYALETQRFPGATHTAGSVIDPVGGSGSSRSDCSLFLNPTDRAACEAAVGTSDTQIYKLNYIVGSCDSLPTVLGPSRGVITAGTCSEGSTRPGSLCLATSTAATFPYDGWVTPSMTCQSPAPASTGGVSDDRCEPVSRNVARAGAATPSYVPVERCQLDSVSASQTADQYWDAKPTPTDQRNLNNDNNACTAEVGYLPDHRLCPKPDDEFCGLIAYDMRAPGTRSETSFDTSRKDIPLPTDVTLGFYTPSYLGFRASDITDAAYAYIDYYTPRPPRIAAPAATCAAGQTCGVQDLDKFSMNGITQGIINVVGGQYRSTIKFFGWAAHEQMAIRHLAVDWGDGMVQDFNDVKLQNHKPYCSVQKECFSPADGFTGLTCQSDNDCPITAQACRSMGSCRDKDTLTCGQDSDCQRDGSKDTCTLREFFGNSAGACQASPFEFSHAYACPRDAASSLPRCSGQNFRSDDSSAIIPPSDVVAPSSGHAGTCFFGSVDSFMIDGRTRPTCTATGTAGRTQCQTAYQAVFGSTGTPADTLNAFSCGPSLDGAAIPVLPTATQGRCSEDTTRFCNANSDCAAGDTCIAAGLAPPGGCWDDLNNACRFTPRVFLQDNWGWCSGECRSQVAGDTLTDAPGSPVKHPYGGCYSPVPLGGNVETQSVRYNTQPIADRDHPNQLTGYDRDIGVAARLECAMDRPLGAFTSTGVQSMRNFRPWIVFPGSVQLRP